MTRSCFLLLTMTVVLAGPRPARADGYVSPGLGVAFGNPSAQGRANFALGLGWLPGRAPIGLELDTTVAPSFFNNQGPYGQNGVTTVMGNVIIAGGDSGRGYRRGGLVRPYVSAGLGVIHTRQGPAFSTSDLGANVGIGLMAVSRRQVGLRGDIRYFRNLVGSSTDTTSTIDFGSFHFWRPSINLVFDF